MSSKIEVKNLTKIFGRSPQEAAQLMDKGVSKEDILEKTGNTVGVDRANFKVNDNEIFVIMGLSGSGKSTLIRMLNHLISPTTGDVYLNGKSITQLDKKELLKVRQNSMSMVFQNFALFPNRTVLENAAYGLEIQGTDKQTRNEAAQKSLDTVGLNGYENELPEQLSGGMQQRVGLARALANDPEILLMDEAFSALDPLNRTEMQDELLDLQASLHKTVIFISHDLNEALKLGDHILMMKDGQVEQIGTPEDILQHPANSYVEQFTQGVDRSKVLTAKNVMIRPNVVDIKKDGPRVALRRMRDNEISSIYAIESDHKYVGLVDAEAADKLIQNDDRDITKAIKNKVSPVSPDTPVNDLITKMSKSSIPLPVVDDDKKLVGIIIRSSILESLTGDSESEEDDK